jgi:histidine phosphotransfer protein HptB
VGTLRTSLAVGSADELARTAHTLKSNAQTFGAATLAELCRELEENAKSERLEGARALITRIESEHAHVAGALKARGEGARPE